LDAVAELPGGRVSVQPEDEVGVPDLKGYLSDVPRGVVYCCGPKGMLQAVLDLAKNSGRDADLHIERFEAASTDAPATNSDQNTCFEVDLLASGITVIVPPERSILDVVSDVVPGVLSSCGEGYCGTCETGVAEGVPDHRDTLLSGEDRASNETVLICVSRSHTPRLVLDL
ncbi:MAG: 2Fe-2S iron-sulfur cluster binding domain-containing protein, partial [Alphaproteobacteria bacterium]